MGSVGGWWFGHGQLRQDIATHVPWLFENQVGAADDQPPAGVVSIGVQTTNFPIVAIILLAVMAAVFVAEIAFGVDPWTGLFEPSTRTLIAFGGLYYPLVIEGGQWHRLLSAPMLHLNAFHLLMNGIALYVAGRILEPMIGRLWFAALFVIGGIGGGLMSLMLNPHNLVSVGASGAIMATFAAIYVLSLRSTGPDRTKARQNALGVLIPSLIPSAGGAAGVVVDYSAHFGGTIMGVLVSGALLALWRHDDDAPPLRTAAAGLAIVAVLAACYSLVADISQYPDFALARFLIPSAQLPHGLDAMIEKGPALAKEYPRDPRARMYNAIALVRANDLTGAEDQVRAALAEKDILRAEFTPALKTHIESFLALILFDQNRSDEARAFARAGCADSSADLHDDLVTADLCETKTR
jgi:rhomboid protease GluP